MLQTKHGGQVDLEQHHGALGDHVHLLEHLLLPPEVTPPRQSHHQVALLQKHLSHPVGEAGLSRLIPLYQFLLPQLVHHGYHPLSVVDIHLGFTHPWRQSLLQLQHCLQVFLPLAQTGHVNFLAEHHDRARLEKVAGIFLVSQGVLLGHRGETVYLLYFYQVQKLHHLFRQVVVLLLDIRVEQHFEKLAHFQKREQESEAHFWFLA